jgi:DivIVA domain-containing protein
MRGVAVFWIMVLVVGVVLFGVAAVAAGHGDAMREVYPDRPEIPLPPDRPLRADDLAAVRFSVGFRGYRMDEVDELVDRVTSELETRDKRIAELEWQLHTAVARFRELQGG